MPHSFLYLLILSLISLHAIPTSACGSKGNVPNVPTFQMPSINFRLLNASYLEVLYTSIDTNIDIVSAVIVIDQEEINIDPITHLVNIHGYMDVCKEQSMEIVITFTVDGEGNQRRKKVTEEYFPAWYTLGEIKESINASICLKENQIFIDKDLNALREQDNSLFNDCFKELIVVTDNDNTTKKTSKLDKKRNSLGLYEEKTVKISMMMKGNEDGVKEILVVYEGQGLEERQTCVEDILIMGLSIGSFSGIVIVVVIIIIMIVGAICVFTMRPSDLQRIGMKKVVKIDIKDDNGEYVYDNDWEDDYEKLGSQRKLENMKKRESMNMQEMRNSAKMKKSTKKKAPSPPRVNTDPGVESDEDMYNMYE